MADATFTAGPWDIGHEEYHADRGCDSWSTLKVFQESAPLYEATYLTGVYSPPGRPEFVIGRATHCLVLEGEAAFRERFGAAPDADRRTKEGKKLWESWREKNPGKLALAPNEVALVCEMAEGVRLNGRAADLLRAAGPVEHAVRWEDPGTGLRLKARFDKLARGERVVADLKTADDPLPRAWPGVMAKYSYHQQAALYLDGADQALGLDCEFYFLAVGKRPPFECCVYRLSADALDQGRRENRELVGELALRKFLGNWQSRHQGETLVADLPGWKR